MNLNEILAAAFLSTFAAAAMAQGSAPPTDAPPKSLAASKKVTDKDNGKKRIEDKDGDQDDSKKDGDKEDGKKDGKKEHRKHHDHKKNHD